MDMEKSSQLHHQMLNIAQQIAGAVARAGGRAYFVGGMVRDRLLNVPCKDVDIEVHLLSPQQLKDILGAIGPWNAMGANFGVYNLGGVDVAMPRMEKATGRGHRDFEIFVDPFLGPEKAAARRDFTVNAMMMDVLSGELLDFYGGQEDLNQKVIRHVRDQSFVEDPLRVFRAAQFSARYDFDIAPETLTLCQRMDVDALPSERVMEEVLKALQKAHRPSRFWEALRQMGQLSPWFAELDDLQAKQPEIFQKAMATVDAAATYRSQSENPAGLMLAALCAWLSPEDGLSLLKRLTKDNSLLAEIPNLLCSAPVLMALLSGRVSDPDRVMKCWDEAVSQRDLQLLVLSLRKADGNAQSGDEVLLRASLSAYLGLNPKAQVTGADFVKAGFAPGRKIGLGVRYAHGLWLQGMDKESAMAQTLTYLEQVE